MRFLLAVPLLALGCTGTTPTPTTPPTAPPPPAASTSLVDLEAEYLPRLDASNRAVDAFEARKEEILAQLQEELEGWRERRRALLTEIGAKEASIVLLERQIEERQQRLATLEGAARTAGRDEMAHVLAAQIGELAAELAAELAELEERRATAARAAAEIERLETTDRDALFLQEVQPLYREGIELHLGFYRGLIDLARRELAADDGSSTLVERFEERMERRRSALDLGIGPAVYDDLRREVDRDRRLGQAWLSAVIQEARFSLSESSLEGISEQDREELSFLADALAEIWSVNSELVMHIDGHADSKRFRGRTPCVSAAENRQLSWRRAETVKALFAERLEGAAERIQIDGFGNFSPLAGTAGDELENRRIELRLASLRPDGSYGAHRDYFAMRDGLALAGTSFVRQPGRWVEASCVGRESEKVEHLSAAHLELAERLGLDDVATVALGAGRGRQIEVRLGNAFVVADGDRCVEIVPCSTNP